MSDRHHTLYKSKQSMNNNIHRANEQSYLTMYVNACSEYISQLIISNSNSDDMNS